MNILCNFCLPLLALSSSLGAQAADAIRFKDPEGITADPTGLLRDTTAFAFPKYPRDLEAEQITGAPVVAFVIDTTGRVELQTASFLNDSRPEFARAVCDMLTRLRFQPFVVAHQKWRVLLVEMFAFNTWAVSDSAGIRAAATLSARSQEEFATEPIDKVVRQLVPLPHCDSGGIATRPGAVAEGSEPPRILLRGNPPSLRVPVTASGRSPVRVTIEVMIDSAGSQDMKTFKLAGYGANENREALTRWIEEAFFRPAYRDGQPVPGLYRTRLEARVVGH